MPGTLVFVHPTKTGGTSVERFLTTGVPPSAVATGGGHTTRVDDALRENRGCLVVLREPLERAKSIYRYYRAGSERYAPNHPTVLSFDAFWTAVDQGRDPGLPRLYMWEDHLRPQSWWIRRDHLDNPDVHVVLNHQEAGTLRQATFDALQTLDIPYDPDSWVDVNVSRYRDEISISPSTDRILRRLFADDLDLWATARKKMLPDCTTHE